ncbi:MULTISPECIES: putative Ig domain-containing protein [unclassified Streptomyces]|uniref:putative Ig domain-containing protein n=1 Tax=unclassified Streptomyces TaxID=2593676 RepID=UPI00068B8EF6|nr:MULTISPECIES: putative Ig domain-containing protein [unclassified Streptomyces]
MSRLLTPPWAAALATAGLATILAASAWTVTATASTASSASAFSVAPSAAPSAAAAALAPEKKCTLPGGLAELSGLAMSRKHPRVFYAVNDSGNTNQVFAVDCNTATGRLLATFTVAGVGNTDWEGLALGTDAGGGPALLVGDIGDNFSGRAELTVHRFAEPDQLTNATVTPVTYRFAYADGKHDAESLLADPVTGRLYVASKLVGAAGKLYQAPLPPVTGQVNTLTEVRPGPVFATDGAFSPTGASYTLRSGGPLGANTASVYDTAGVKLADVALPAQSQGETVTYADCAHLLVGSENDTQIWRVPLPPEATPGCDGTPTPTPSPTPTPTATPTPTPTPGGLQFTDLGPQTCTFNRSCTIQLTTTGAKPPVRYAVTGLPWGLTLDSTSGRITGKPWGSGAFQVTATASDATGATAGTTFTLTLNWF